MSQLEFETKRLLVRRWRDSDLPVLLAVYGDVDAMRWVGDGRAITQEECVQWLAVTRSNYERRGYGMFAIEERSSPGVVGFCGIVHPGGQPEPEVKYALAPFSLGSRLSHRGGVWPHRLRCQHPQVSLHHRHHSTSEHRIAQGAAQSWHAAR